MERDRAVLTMCAALSRATREQGPQPLERRWRAASSRCQRVPRQGDRLVHHVRRELAPCARVRVEQMRCQPLVFSKTERRIRDVAAARRSQAPRVPGSHIQARSGRAPSGASSGASRDVRASRLVGQRGAHAGLKQDRNVRVGVGAGLSNERCAAEAGPWERCTRADTKLIAKPPPTQQSRASRLTIARDSPRSGGSSCPISVCE